MNSKSNCKKKLSPVEIFGIIRCITALFGKSIRKLGKKINFFPHQEQPQQGNEARIRVLQQEMARLQPYADQMAQLQQQLDELRPFIIQYNQFSEELKTLTRQDQQQQSSSTDHAAGRPSPKNFFSRISSVSQKKHFTLKTSF